MAKSIRVRMYRTGFGDCFLMSFGAGASGRHVLVDFGAHMAGEIGTMEPIMDNIEAETGKKLLLLVATHAHRDHMSGFGQFADRFASFSIDEIWMPWTDDPDHKEAAALQRKQLALYDTLRTHLRIALKGAGRRRPSDAAAVHALDNLRGNEPAKLALRRGFGTGAKIQYLKAGVSGLTVGDFDGLVMDILGPPSDAKALGRMNPPADQRFLTAPSDPTTALHPFPTLEIRDGEPDYELIEGAGQPLLTSSDLEALRQAASVQADRLALVLDSVRNNTSLVIRFRFQGKSLLFPGDAQWGNWQSWIGTDQARELLSELDFFKVAHHGSENATPVDVVRALKTSGLAAMVPTQVRPFPTIPRQPLLDELEQHLTGHVAVRSDWIQVDDAPVGPRPKLPTGFRAGKLWIDYAL